MPFRHLIYPVPERDGLGVHLTLDMAGQGRFGPDTEWVEAIDYRLDARRGDGFYAAIRRYWPEIPDGALAPTYAGVRPKLFPEGGAATDFAIEGPEVHGLPGLVNLFGIESPGLTASLAIADEVLGRLGDVRYQKPSIRMGGRPRFRRPSRSAATDPIRCPERSDAGTAASRSGRRTSIFHCRPFDLDGGGG